MKYFNYYLIISGFMSFQDPSLKIPGNNMFRDILMALKWLNNSNLSQFGGNPHNITLFGTSSGSISIEILMTCPLAKGLFHKAILMGGFFQYFNELPNFNYRVAKSIGYQGSNSETELYEFFKNVEGERLTKTNVEGREKFEEYPFFPFLEPYKNEQSIMTKQPAEAWKECWGHSLPILLGDTSQEALSFYNIFNKPEYFEKINKDLRNILSAELRDNCSVEVQLKVAQSLRKLHFGDSELDMKNIFKLLELKSYELYSNKNRFINSRLEKNLAPNYLYRFAVDSDIFNLYRIRLGIPGMRGAIHADELSYLFYLILSFKLEKNSYEFKTIERIMDIWTTFAAKSDPNCESTKAVKWQPVEKNGSRMCLNIAEELNYIEMPESKKLAVWDQLLREVKIVV